ncbi:MAG: hypothetical protein Q8K65_05450 [Alphaproteobacteria bacterium]|nr:hypothetical protein [Alphaproteobacteria bacterium]
MTAEKETSAQARLQNDLRQAVVENDAARVELLLGDNTLDEDFRFELIGGLVAAGDHAALVTRLLADAGENITPTAYISYLSSAARQGHVQTAALLAENCTAAGIAADECGAVVVRNAPADKIIDVARAVAARDAQPEQRFANMILTAATNDQHDSLSAMLSTGADIRGHGGIILLMLLEDRAVHFSDDEKKSEYLALLGQVIDSCHESRDIKSLDLLMTLVAYRLPEGKEYPELMERLADAGADPFSMKEEAQRFLVKAYEEKDDPVRADKWRDWFDTRKEAYTARHAHVFDTLFGTDFRLQDLRQNATDEGDNGLQLAAKARRIPQLMKNLAASDDLSIDDIFAENKRGESILTLAIDRGDATALLSPTYWGRRDVDVMAVLEQKLSDDRKKWIDMGAIAAQIDHYSLLNLAEDFQPQLRLRPRAR